MYWLGIETGLIVGAGIGYVFAVWKMLPRAPLTVTFDHFTGKMEVK